MALVSETEGCQFDLLQGRDWEAEEVGFICGRGLEQLDCLVMKYHGSLFSSTFIIYFIPCIGGFTELAST